MPAPSSAANVSGACFDTIIGMQHNKETSAAFAVLRGYRCARFENLSVEIAVPSLQNLHGLPRLNIWKLRGGRFYIERANRFKAINGRIRNAPWMKNERVPNDHLKIRLRRKSRKTSPKRFSTTSNSFAWRSQDSSTSEMSKQIAQAAFNAARRSKLCVASAIFCIWACMASRRSCNNWFPRSACASRRSTADLSTSRSRSSSQMLSFMPRSSV